MKNKSIFCAALLCIFFMNSCMIRIIPKSDRNALSEVKKITASKANNTKESKLEDFSAIEITGSMDVVFAYGEPSIRIKGPENVIDCVEFSIFEDELLLSMCDTVRIMGSYDLTVYVNSKELKEFTISGSSDSSLSGLDEDRLSVAIAGSGDIEMNNIKVKSLEISIAGSGDVDIEHLDSERVVGTIVGSGDMSISGKSERADFTIRGSGNIDADDLKCNKITFN